LCAAASATPGGCFLLGFFEGFGVLPVFAVLVVFLSFFGVAQHFVGLIDLLKLLIGFLVIRIQVGVMFAS
jgi:hypothetical protein